MKTFASVTILLTCFTGAFAQAPTPVPSAGTASSGVPMSQATTIQPAAYGSPSAVAAVDQLQQTLEAADETPSVVLIVPGPDIKPGTLASLTEDMTVMCRVFDKALSPGRRSSTRSFSYGRAGALSQWFGQEPGQTQGLYLDGYGAVFFVGVDFPLVAPPQQNEQAKAQESGDRVWSQSGDRVWSQTVDELRGRPAVDPTGQAVPAYDPQKVDSLKANLIKTLRHAANLRLGPQDQVTVVVGARNEGAQAGAWQHLRYMRQPNAGRRVVPSSNSNRADGPAADPAATLILRVAKTDLDALAAGPLSPDQFASKVVVLWSTPQAQAAPTPAQ